MPSYTLYILTAFSLIFVIEGLVYALFPDTVRKMMAVALSIPPRQLRLFGAIMAAAGLCLIWAMHTLLQKQAAW